MKKIFKSKKVNKTKLTKIIKLLTISFLCAYFLNKINFLHNSKIIEYFSDTSLNKIHDIDLDIKGNYLLNISLNKLDKIKIDKKVIKKQEYNNTNGNPKVYIYNTHQTEEYKTLEPYNLTPTVLTAAYVLKDKLNTLGINAIVEESNMKEELNRLGYNYNDSYSVSRNWLENLGLNNLDLYIDLHRDSPEYKYSNITVDGKDYAKIMFVVGTGHDYSENLKVVNTLIKNIENINKSISKGIFTRGYKYNQDFNKNCVLIEIGGPESTFTSISNTIDVLSLAIKQYIDGN